VFRAIAALTLASAATHPATPPATHPATPPAASHAPADSAAAHAAETPLPSSPWWERVTVTISGDGKPQGCKFESSLKPTAPQTCDVEGKDASAATASSSGAKAEYTRITFERRFKPGVQPDAGNLQPGETLIGGQVMALGIDAHGAVKTCKVVSQSGAMRPQYGCAEATTEKFEASAGAAQEPAREGLMTVMVYGHSEHVV